MKSIKLLRDWETKPSGSILRISDEGAEQFVSQGFAEYVDADSETLKAMATPPNFSESRIKSATQARMKIFEEEDPFTQDWVALTSVEKEVARRTDIERIRRKFAEDKPLATAWTAQLLMRDYRIHTIDDNLFVYVDGIYFGNAEEFLRSRIQAYGFGKFISCHTVNEVIGYVKRETFAQLSKLAAPITQICLMNGILDLDSKELTAHTAERFFVNKVNAAYFTDADCPAFKKFLGEVLTPDDIRLIQELFGYCLWRDLHVHKAVMLTGGGANGKSTLLNVLRALLGQNNIASVSLQSLEDHRFFVAELYGKLANVYPDLPPTEMKGTGVFKCLTGQDQITVERKHGQPFNFVSYAKLIFSANQIPAVKDDSDAFYRRWIIIPFNKQFLDNPDTMLAGKLTTPAELDGILKWALDGLQRVLEKGFTHNKTVEQVRDHYTRLSNPLRAFVQDCVEFVQDDDVYIAKDALFREFLRYCRAQKMPAIGSSEGFSKGFYSEIPTFVFEQQKRLELGRVRVWCNVRLKTTFINTSGTGGTPDTPFFLLPVTVGIISSIGKKGVSPVPLVPTHNELLVMLKAWMQNSEKDIQEIIDSDMGFTEEFVKLAIRNGELFEPRTGRVKFL